MAKEIITEEQERALIQMDFKAASLSDLLGVYRLICEHRDLGFGRLDAKAKKVVSSRLREVEDELCNRVYGFNPFVSGKPEKTIEGVKPEEIDLDRFAVAKPVDKELKDEQPKTFVVGPDKEGE